MGHGQWFVVVGCRSCDGSFYIRDDDDDDDEKRGSRRRETRVLYLPVLEEKLTTSTTATTLTMSRDSIHSCQLQLQLCNHAPCSSKAVGGGLHRAKQQKRTRDQTPMQKRVPASPLPYHAALSICQSSPCMTSSTTTTLCVQRDFPSSEGWGDRKTGP